MTVRQKLQLLLDLAMTALLLPLMAYSLIGETAHEWLGTAMAVLFLGRHTSGQLSLAWMLCKKPYIIPIPGSRKEERLWENLEARDVRLSENEIVEIDTLLDRMEMPVYGQRPKKG